MRPKKHSPRGKAGECAANTYDSLILYFGEQFLILSFEQDLKRVLGRAFKQLSVYAVTSAVSGAVPCLFCGIEIELGAHVGAGDVNNRYVAVFVPVNARSFAFEADDAAFSGLSPSMSCVPSGLDLISSMTGLTAPATALPKELNMSAGFWSTGFRTGSCLWR